MCDQQHHKAHSCSGRYGSRLEHGIAHTEDHRRWTRRSFLTHLGAAAAGLAFSIGGTRMDALGASLPLSPLRSVETDRILVLIELNGGNDGLNTIVPFRNDIYYRARPTLGIPRSELIQVSDDLGFHRSLGPLEPMWHEGHMGVIHNVGYAQQDLSHFRSMDIWGSASDADEHIKSGWLGRFLDRQFPETLLQPLDRPLAVSIAGSQLPFQGPDLSMGIQVDSLETLEQLVETGGLHDPFDVTETLRGHELSFIRRLTNESFRFGSVMQESAGQATNKAAYPDRPTDVPTPSTHRLGDQLAIVARFIKGGLDARIYMVTLNGFDTHATQGEGHAALLRYVAESVHAFYADLSADGYGSDVLTMTFSEFGRRVDENGSRGTDHGAAAPILLFGPPVLGGFYGTPPDLTNLDQDDNLRFTTDFRSVYSTLLVDWFGVPVDAMTSIFGQPFDLLNFVSNPSTVTPRPYGTVSTATDESLPGSITLGENYPNPFSTGTTLTFTVDRSVPVRLQVFDLNGKMVRSLLDRVMHRGTHRIPFEAGSLPSGTYVYRLETPHGNQSRTMSLLR